MGPKAKPKAKAPKEDKNAELCAHRTTDPSEADLHFWSVGDSLSNVSARCSLQSLQSENELLQKRLEEEFSLSQRLRQVQSSKDVAVLALQSDAERLQVCIALAR